MTWTRLPLKDIGRWYGGGTPSKSNETFWSGGSIPWLSPKDMGDMTLVSTQDHITPSAVAGSTVKVVPAQSVAVVVRSGILERTLPVATVPFETTLNQDMKAVVPHVGIDPKWVAWGLRAYEHELLRDTRKAGTTVASIEMPRFYAFELPVPSIGEQRRIVEILEDHLSRLDAAEHDVVKAKMLTQTVMASFLHRGIVGNLMPLGDLATEACYGTSTKCVADGPGLPVVRIPNLVDGRIDLTDEKRAADRAVNLDALILRKGDLLIVRTNGSLDLIGRSAVVTESMAAAFASYLIRYRVDQTRVRPLWVRLAMESPRARFALEAMAASSAGQHNLGLKKLDTVLIPVPSLAEQDRVVRRAGELQSALAAFRAELSQLKRRLAALRRAVLTAAFSGKLAGSASDFDCVEELAN